MPTYTAEQCVAFSFVALARGDRSGRWRTEIDPHKLSFTEPGWDPLTQRFGSVDDGLRELLIIPGSDSGLGFAALTNADGSVNEEDARRKRAQWVIFLTPEDET